MRTLTHPAFDTLGHKYIFMLCISLTLWCQQEQFSQVLDAMFEVIVQPQEHVINQGDDGDNFYVIERLVH